MECTESMEILGIVEEITCDGRMIVRCNELPDIGAAVFDRRQTRLGSVGRVFGPVDGPYASVTPEGGPAKIGTETYYRGNKQNAKGKRRNRRD